MLTGLCAYCKREPNRYRGFCGIDCKNSSEAFEDGRDETAEAIAKEIEATIGPLTTEDDSEVIRHCAAVARNYIKAI